MSEQNIRYHSIDFLRAAAMLLGIFYHVGISFFTHAERWIVKDIAATPVVDTFLVYSHIFRMPLFFIIAGFFCALVIARKGKAALLKNRLKRIGLPLFIFGVLFIPAWMALIYYSYVYVEPTTEFVAKIMEGANANKPPSLLELPLGHLWFLYYLLIFYVAYVLIEPLLSKIFKKLNLYQGLAIFAFLTGLGLMLSPSLALEIFANFKLQSWAVALYGLSFVSGAFLYYKRDSFKLLEERISVNILLGFVVLAPFFVWYILSGTKLEGIQLLLVNIIYAVAIFTMCFGLIGLTNKMISATNKTVRYLSDASYWLYIMHMPIIVYLQIRWYDWEINGALKYLLILAMVMIPLLLIYQFMIRYSFIGTMLNGKKYKSKANDLKEVSVSN